MSALGTVQLSKNSTAITATVTYANGETYSGRSVRTYTIRTAEGNTLGQMQTVLGDSYLKITSIENYTEKDGQNRVQGVGKRLFECAFAESCEKGYEGNISLQATGGQFFYWAMHCEPEAGEAVWPRFGGSPNASDVYAMVKRQEPLDSWQQEYIKKERALLAKERGISEEAVPLEDLFLLPIKEQMRLLFNRAVLQKKEARWLHSEIRMRLSQTGIAIWKQRVLDSPLHHPVHSMLALELWQTFDSAPQNVKELIEEYIPDKAQQE